MRNIRLLICDRDRAYIDALVTFLVTTKNGLSVCAYSSESAFEKDVGEYDIGVLGDSFIDLGEKKDRIKHLMYLSSVPGGSYEDYQTVYKFQDMKTFLGIIKRQCLDDQCRKNTGSCTWTGIYSPIHHELQLPFSLSYAHQLSSDNSVLFLDLEENSILGDLIDISSEKTLMDYLYLLDSGSSDIYSDISQYSDISYLAPMTCFPDLSQIDSDLWERFYSSI